jgi:1-acyl-sn-glycerol-3-phosphate acyltransferase
MYKSFISFLEYYIPIVFIFLNWLYKNCNVYYKPLEYKDKSTGKTINVHKLYEPFQAKDKLRYWRFILSGMIFFIPKLIFCMLTVIGLIIHLRIAHFFYKYSDTNITHRNKIKKIIKFWSYLGLKTAMINVKEKKVSNCEEIYKKYLGNDYDFSDKKFSLIISNHIGLFDVILAMYLYQPGFIAKKLVSDYPFFGSVARGLNCLFVDRENENARKKILGDIYIKQKNYLEGKSLAPLAIFPEGTTTSNRNILKFKKGAFYHLLPIKPQIVQIDQNSPLHIACGVQNIFFHTWKIMAYSCSELFYIDMPVIRPTEFMFKNYSHLGKEKWEIYAEITRKIYCEIGGFEESDLGYRDDQIYSQAILSGKYQPNKSNMDNKNKKNV